MRRAAALFLLALPAAAGAQPAYDPGRVAWSRLEFEASKLWLTARSEVELGRRPASEAAAELFQPAEGEVLQPGGRDSYLIAIHTTFLSRDSRVRFWFEPGDARALQRSELSTSKKRNRHRTYRYARRGVHAHTITPRDGEDDLPHGEWTRVHDHFVAFPESSDGLAVTEPAALLYAVPAAALDAPGDRLVLHVFSRRRVATVDVRVEARERIGVDYVEVSPAGERPVEGDVDALRVALRPRPPADGRDDGIELLGLQGDIDLYLDPRTRAPLLITGKIKIAGTVHLRAKRVVLAGRPG